MKLRSRVSGIFVGLALVGAVGILPSFAQDPAQEKAASKKEKGSTSGKGYRRVPANFSKVGLTDEQRQKVYQIRGKYQNEITTLKSQIEDLQAKELTDCEGVLLDSQKKVLADLRATSKPSKKAASEKAKGEDKSEK
jgi:hypothetical protein